MLCSNYIASYLFFIFWGGGANIYPVNEGCYIFSLLIQFPVSTNNILLLRVI